jgi:gamma-glutamyltranspeptidase/glutathione hydrolase
MNLESSLPEGGIKELQGRGHDVSTVKPFGVTGCATAVLIDPATNNRIAGADPRRDCYAMAY